MTEKRIRAIFYRNEAGTEPVRDWSKALNKEDRYLIGTDIKTVEFGWPIGMPTCRPMGGGLFEVRTNLPQGRIARVLFCIYDGSCVLRLCCKNFVRTENPCYGSSDYATTPKI